MELKLICNDRNIHKAIVKGRKILEIDSAVAGRAYNDLRLYDPCDNTYRSLMPELKNESILPVYNCIWRSQDIYFALLCRDENSSGTIKIFRLYLENEKSEIVLSIPAADILSDMNSILKVFILTDKYIVIQTETKKNADTDSLMGNIKFSQILYNITSGQSSIVTDPNLVNNGINIIIPVSTTHIVLKTGYSPIEDNRINRENEEDALIESVYYSSMSLFVSSLLRESAFAGDKMLGNAYFNKNILTPKVSGEFIIFTIIDIKSRFAETVFYNFVSDTFFRCVNDNADITDLDNAYVIDNIPYLRNTFRDRTEFFNVKNAETDCIFYDEEFIDAKGKLFFFKCKEKGHELLRIYKAPQLNLILQERCIFNCCCEDDDIYYIYLKK